MADGRGKRARKVVDYTAFSGGSDSDDDFKDDVILPTSKTKIQKPSKLKLKDKKTAPSMKSIESSTIPVKSTSKLSLPEVPYITVEKIASKENIQPNITHSSQEGDASVSDPDLDVHGLSSQETIVLSCGSVKSEEKDEKETTEAVFPQDTKESDHNNESDETDWETGNSNRKPIKIEQKRKVNDSKDQKGNKKPKMDNPKKEINKNVANVAKNYPPENQANINPINQPDLTRTIATSDPLHSRNICKPSVWNPPGKQKVCNSPVAGSSPTIGLRLGLSRHGRVKPLHRVANIKS